jgi:hypothetical protein
MLKRESKSLVKKEGDDDFSVTFMSDDDSLLSSDEEDSNKEETHPDIDLYINDGDLEGNIRYWRRSKCLNKILLVRMKYLEIIDQLINSKITDLADFEFASLIKYGVFFKNAPIQGQKFDYKLQKENNELYENYHVLKEIFTFFYANPSSVNTLDQALFENNVGFLTKLASKDLLLQVHACALNVSQSYGFELLPRSNNSFILAPST